MKVPELRLYLLLESKFILFEKLSLVSDLHINKSRLRRKQDYWV